MKTASIRQLRTAFPKVRALIEREGGIVVTERGQAAYLITPYIAPKPVRRTRKNYLARLLANMPAPVSMKAVQAIDDLNRSER